MNELKRKTIAGGKLKGQDKESISKNADWDEIYKAEMAQGGDSDDDMLLLSGSETEQQRSRRKGRRSSATSRREESSGSTQRSGRTSPTASQTSQHTPSTNLDMARSLRANKRESDERKRPAFSTAGQELFPAVVDDDCSSIGSNSEVLSLPSPSQYRRSVRKAKKNESDKRPQVQIIGGPSDSPARLNRRWRDVETREGNVFDRLYNDAVYKIKERGKRGSRTDASVGSFGTASYISTRSYNSRSAGPYLPTSSLSLGAYSSSQPERMMSTRPKRRSGIPAHGGRGTRSVASASLGDRSNGNRGRALSIASSSSQSVSSRGPDNVFERLYRNERKSGPLKTSTPRAPSTRLQQERKRRLQAIRNRSATYIQSWWRMMAVKMVYNHHIQEAIRIQTWWRMVLVSSDYETLRICTIWLQAIVRGYLCRVRMEREELGAVEVPEDTTSVSSEQERWDASCATLIQAVYRGSVSRQLYENVLLENWASTRIQSSWRRYQAEQSYADLRNSLLDEEEEMVAAEIIQAVVRGYLARQLYDSLLFQNWAAFRIQSAFRQYISASSFSASDENAEQNASISIEAAARGSFARHKAVLLSENVALPGLQHSDQLEEAVVLIQALVRGWSARRDFASLRAAVHRLQQKHTVSQLDLQEGNRVARRALFAAGIEDIILRSMKDEGALRRDEEVQSALLIENAFRKYLALARYAEKRASAILIQALARGSLARANLEIEVSAAITMQSCFRGYRVRKCSAPCNTLVSSVGKQKLTESYGAARIQKVWRNYRAAMMLAKTRKSAMLSPSGVSGYVCRTDDVSFRDSVVLLRSMYRRRMAEEEYQNSAATKIQTAWRSHVVMRDYQRLRIAAVVLQSKFRCRLLAASLWRFRTASSLARARGAVIRIQSVARMQRCGWLYLSKMKQNPTITPGKKHLSVSPSAGSRLQQEDVCATTVQCYWRRYVAVSRLSDLRLSATILQSMFRGHNARMHYLALRIANSSRQRDEDAAATLIQTNLRRYISGSSFLRARLSAILIQSFVRGYLTRKAYIEYASEQSAVTLIQSALRGHTARVQCLAMKEAVEALHKAQQEYPSNVESLRRDAAASIQTSWRHLSASRMLQKQNAALTLQVAWRGYCTRSLLAAQFENERSVAASTIQLFFRRLVVVLASKRSLAAVRIQTCVRRSMKMAHYASVIGSAVMLQKCWRAYSLRKSFLEVRASCEIIQAAARRFLAEKVFVQCVQSVTLIQVHWRMRRAVLLRKRKYRSLLVLQSFIRGLQARAMYSHSVRSATLIQSAWRAYICRKPFFAFRLVVVKTQASARSSIARRRYIKKTEAAVIVQKIWRVHRASMLFSKYRRSSIIVQRRCRGVLARRSVENRRRFLEGLARATAAAQIIEKAWRKCQDVSKEANMSASTIQRSWRIYKKIIASIKIQSAFRGHRIRGIFLSLKRATRAIQRKHRLRRYQRDLQASSAAEVIQKRWRQRMAYMMYCGRRNTVVVLQRTGRGYLARKKHIPRLRSVSTAKSTGLVPAIEADLSSEIVAAILIQKMWRRHDAMALLSKSKRAAVAIEAAARRQICRQKYLSLLSSGLIIQDWLRSYQTRTRFTIFLAETRRLNSAATLIQAFVRSYLLRKRQRSLQAAARRIQATYRSYRMEASLLKLESASVLLYRSVQGALTQSTCIFALQQINSCLRSNSCSNTSIRTEANTSGWDRAKSAARHFAAIIIQRRYRGHMCRAVLLQEGVTEFSAGSTMQTLFASPKPSTRLDLSSPVAARVLERITQQRTRVKLCVAAYLREQHAARLIQSTFRATKRLQQERLAVLKNFMLERVLLRLNQTAKQRASDLLLDAGAECTPCVSRYAQRARTARSAAADLNNTLDRFSQNEVMGTPVHKNRSVFSEETKITSELMIGFQESSLLSPIPATEKSLVMRKEEDGDGWDFDDDM